jgi:hypothetical protein
VLFSVVKVIQVAGKKWMCFVVFMLPGGSVLVFCMLPGGGSSSSKLGLSSKSLVECF